jgi:hypothetical protein
VRAGAAAARWFTFYADRVIMLVKDEPKPAPP